VIIAVKPRKTSFLFQYLRLVGGLEHVWFSSIVGNNNPNWRTHIFQRGGSTTNQLRSPLSCFVLLRIMLMKKCMSRFAPGNLPGPYAVHWWSLLVPHDGKAPFRRQYVLHGIGLLLYQTSKTCLESGTKSQMSLICIELLGVNRHTVCDNDSMNDSMIIVSILFHEETMSTYLRWQNFHVASLFCRCGISRPSTHATVRPLRHVSRATFC